MVLTAASLAVAILSVLALIGAQLPFDLWGSDRVAPFAGGSAVLNPPAALPPRVTDTGPAAPVVVAATGGTAPAPSGDGGAAAPPPRSTPTPAPPRETEATIPTVSPAPAATPEAPPAATPPPAPTPQPTLLAGPVHSTAATVRQTGEDLNLDPVTGPVADTLDQVGDLLPERANASRMNFSDRP